MKKMFTKAFSVFLSLLIVMSVVPFGAFAVPDENVAEVWVNGEMKASSGNSIEEMWKEAVKLAPSKAASDEDTEVVLKLLSNWKAETVPSAAVTDLKTVQSAFRLTS